MNTTLNNVRKTSAYAEESLVVDLQSMLHTVMIETGMSRAQLADAMGVSKARVTQLFSDDCSNFTVRLLARAMFAMGERLEVTCPAHRRATQRIRMNEVIDQRMFDFGSTARWDMPANDRGPYQVASAERGDARTSGLIARAMQNTHEGRRAA